LIQAFVPDNSSVALDVGILFRLACLDMPDGNSAFYRLWSLDQVLASPEVVMHNVMVHDLDVGESRVGRLMHINWIKPFRTRRHKVTTTKWLLQRPTMHSYLGGISPSAFIAKVA
jgi:hypothetical protein